MTFNAASEVPVTAAGYTASGEVSFGLGFAPTPGTNLTVIKNTSPAFISGQFSNLANGETVNLIHNGTTYPFVAWYYGGEGNNDLVLLWSYTGLAAWGQNYAGQLGTGTPASRGVPVSVDQAGTLLGKTIVQVARGQTHSLALCSDGTVAAWGSNAYGQLGDIDWNWTDRNVPVSVNVTGGISALAGKTVISIAAGGYHNLALCSDGTVVAWGRNDYSQLGNNSTAQPYAPVAVNAAAGVSPLAGKTVMAIAAGEFHSLALCSDGTLAAWGYNHRGQLGDNSTTTRPVPVAVDSHGRISAMEGGTLIAIAAGKSHSLSLCSNGTMAAWGDNEFGQLGEYRQYIQSRQFSYYPVAVNMQAGVSALAGKNVVSIAAGDSHNLALCSDGAVAAWGSNYSGQLGDNSMFTSIVPVAVNTAGTSALAGKAVVSVAAGQGHSHALCSDGTLAGWGQYLGGQLGTIISPFSPIVTVPAAVNVEPGISVLYGRPVTGLAIGSQASHSLAIYGSTTPEIEVEVLEPTVAALTHNVGSVDFGAGVAVGRTFRVRNSGGVALANLVVNITGADAASFSLVSQPVPAINGGGSTSFHVACTGGSLGAKSATLEITSNDSDESLFRIALVGNRTGVLTASFGSATDTPLTAPAINLTGAEVNLTLNFAPTPGTNLTLIKNTGLGFITGQFSSLTNGSRVNLSYAGKVYSFVVWYYGGEGNNDLVLLWPHTGLAAWGYNVYGQLGDNSTTNRHVPVDMADNGVLRRKTIVQVARGSQHSLALCSDGSVAAWGNNYYGQLGDGSTNDRLLPVAVSTAAGSALAGKTVISVAAGGYHSLAVCSDGTVAAWGHNYFGQLGDTRTTDRLLPVAVNVVAGRSALAGKTVCSVAAGDSHSLALCSDGKVVAWGDGGKGQIGHEAMFAGRPGAVDETPGTALAGKIVCAVAAGDSHSLALCSDGTLAAWGRNSSGQIGDSSTTNRRVPTALSYNKQAIGIAAGSSHSLALFSDGTVSAWGENGSGQLGDNSTTDRLRPGAVNVAVGTSALAGKTVVEVAAGERYSLALCSDGTIASWGSNTYGNLGDKSTTFRQVPVAVNVEAGISALAARPVSRLAAGGNSDYSLAIYGQEAVSQITVTGNGANISPSDLTPSVMDHTDFGSTTLIHAQVSHAFTIVNEGNTPLKFSGTSPITLSGPGADAFDVSLEPTNSVASDGSTIFAISFDPTLPGLHTATVTIQSDALNYPSFSFNVSGFGALSTSLRQSITFSPPATVYLGQGPLSLSAYASSGLPVRLSVVSAGTTAPGASIVGDVLSYSGAGTVKVQAVQAGGGLYAAAPTVVKTITVRANPTPLTLLNLAQIYTGTPRAISILGGTGTVTVEYKIGTVFGSSAPTHAGSYAVRATDSTGTKTGTLVIAKAPLYVTPNDLSKFVGQDNPPLTLKFSGWVHGESASLVSTAPLLRTTATKASLGGVYPITASGGAALANYAFIYQQGALVVDSFAANYEALLTDGSGPLVGKLAITVAAANTTFTGKLYCTAEKTALSLSGRLATNPGTESATGSATVTSSGIPYVVSLTLQQDGGLSANVSRDGSSYASLVTGRRLLTLAGTKTVAYSGAHTAVLEPATPANGDVSPGAGWATAVVSTKGVMTLAGRLADGTSFTTSLSPDESSDPVYRLFVQPYKTGAATRLHSGFGGVFVLLPHPSSTPALAGRRYVEAANLSWVKAGLATDATYRAGFGPVNTVLMLDPWLPPTAARGTTPAIRLAERLGLTLNSFGVLHSDTGSASNGNLPTRVGLSATHLVSVTTPLANTTRWKTTLVPTTGLFSGSFQLADPPARPRDVTFSGVLRQPAQDSDVLIGGGHYVLPPLTGTEKTSGEVLFVRP